MSEIYFRPSAVPSVVLPVNVRSAGFYNVKEGFNELREGRPFFQLFWVLAGEGTFRVDDETYPAVKDTVFLYYPGETHDFQASGQWDYYWLTLDNATLEPLFMSLQPTRQKTGRACPVSLFYDLFDALKDPLEVGEIRASVLAYDILLRAYRGEGSGGEHISRLAIKCRDMIDHEFTRASLSIQEVTERLGVHRATLFRSFKENFGLSPIQYLVRKRLGMGLRLLSDTVEPVADVANKCGIADITYFSRLIKGATGLSPRAFRKSLN